MIINGDGKSVLEAGVQGLCCDLVVLSIVFILRNTFSPSVVGKAEGEAGELSGLPFFPVLSVAAGGG